MEVLGGMGYAQGHATSQRQGWAGKVAQVSSHKGLCSSVFQLCPIVRFWFYIINQQLNIMENTYSPRLLTNLHSAFSRMHQSPEQCYHLDFQDKYFPSSFINWLVDVAETRSHSY
ncbi:uncharacterized protein LOC143683675 [Tamandua tetradactyla]|uniref:uncharacterized protein LOC143683675 n=1 Tax=Tamandua tetradactyla TaxID=48850 RepID=UPI0040539838